MKEVVIRFTGRLFVAILIGAGALFILLFLMSYLFTFEGLAYEDDLVGGYRVQAVDTRKDAAIYRENQVVPPMVFAYGWNDDFILAKRHPSLDGWKPNLYVTHWYLIEVHTAKVHGPLTEQQSTELRRELGTLAELTFTKTIRPD
ncbi:MAG: DUF3997 domain-containing protein [Planctomycetes bacterium]|nr:DUF3997 domain-containing protein [Planctomycetota bacterium]